jgi:hypothetical protein
MRTKYCLNPKCSAPITHGRSDKKFCNASCKSMADRIKNQPIIKKLQFQNKMIRHNEKILESCFNNINPNNDNPIARIVHRDAIKAMGLDENYIRKTIYEDVGKLKSSPVFYLINYHFTTHPEMENHILIFKTNPINKNKSL